jgi:hypothetical protein
MARFIDGKSLSIGGLVVLAAVCAMAMTAAPRMKGEHNGRFAMIVYPAQEGRSNVAVAGGIVSGDGHGGVIDNGSIVYPLPSLYILDTATGQVWTPAYPNVETFYTLPSWKGTPLRMNPQGPASRIARSRKGARYSVATEIAAG